MHLNVVLNYDLSVDEVVDLQCDEGFLQFKADETKTVLLAADVIRHDGGAVTSAVRRTMTSDLIPALGGNQLEVRQTEAGAEPELSPGTRHGTFALEITGAPVRISGSMTVRAADAGAVLEYAGDVVASVPLFAATVETAVGQAITQVLVDEEALARQWLASRS
mgnify:CR=1 FL=1